MRNIHYKKGKTPLKPEQKIQASSFGLVVVCRLRKLFHEETKRSMWHAHRPCVQCATKHGFCVPRCQQVVNAMIEKEPGNPSLRRLQVIYENDYNLILGIIFWVLLHKCLDTGCIHDGCLAVWPTDNLWTLFSWKLCNMITLNLPALIPLNSQMTKDHVMIVFLHHLQM